MPTAGSPFPALGTTCLRPAQAHLPTDLPAARSVQGRACTSAADQAAVPSPGRRLPSTSLPARWFRVLACGTLGPGYGMHQRCRPGCLFFCSLHCLHLVHSGAQGCLAHAASGRAYRRSQREWTNGSRRASRPESRQQARACVWLCIPALRPAGCGSACCICLHIIFRHSCAPKAPNPPTCGPSFGPSLPGNPHAGM